MKKTTIAAAFGVLAGAASIFGSEEFELHPGRCLYDPVLRTASIFDESDNATKSIHLRNPKAIGEGNAYSGDTSTFLSVQPLSGQWERITVHPDGLGNGKAEPVCALEGVDAETRYYRASEMRLPEFDP